jgi:hypothetical protein
MHFMYDIFQTRIHIHTHALQPTFAARRAHLVLFLHSLLVFIVMCIDFAAFVWLHVVVSEMDFLCHTSPSPDQCSVLVFDGYVDGRVVLLATIIALHTSLIVSNLPGLAVSKAPNCENTMQHARGCKILSCRNRLVHDMPIPSFAFVGSKCSPKSL